MVRRVVSKVGFLAHLVHRHRRSSVHTSDMKSRVFVSCGQRAGEKEVANKVGKLLEKRGFDVYIAIDVQTILDINAGIIRELKNSDCYLFVNFRREPIGDKYRGSLFSNQELAIAYALGFERILVINQSGVMAEGMLRYIAINTEEFVELDDCCTTVERALDRAGWTADYSRRLRADQLRISDEVIRYRNLTGRFLYINIWNHRSDIAALEATARLSEFGPTGQALQQSPIRSPLKATAFPGFSHTIFPKSHEAFDLLCVGTYGKAAGPNFSSSPASGAIVGSAMPHEKPGVFLNSALDVLSAPCLPITPGTWQLRYEFFAIDFPVLSVLVDFTLTDRYEPSAKIHSQEVI